MLYYILLQLKMISVRNLLKGVLPKGNYGRYLWVQRSSECMGITKHVLHNKQMSKLWLMAFKIFCYEY
jgi:hypothetical protein